MIAADGIDEHRLQKLAAQHVRIDVDAVDRALKRRVHASIGIAGGVGGQHVVGAGSCRVGRDGLAVIQVKDEVAAQFVVGEG